MNKRGKDLLGKRKFIILLISAIVLLGLISALILFFVLKNQIPKCGDGTLEGECSSVKPYFCINGTLTERALICECPELLERNGNSCVSQYQTNPKNVNLEYVLRGKVRSIDFTVYQGVVDYLLGIPTSIYYSGGNDFLRQDFKLKKINEEVQREMLLPLVVKIQNEVQSREDQARIATSLVQRISYRESNRTVVVGFDRINYSRYAYEVLYEMRGACEGRSELLAFLLKELGYETALFYYSEEDHETVGIKCPVEYSLNNSGYCFIETTGPSIISNSEEYYLGQGKLNSKPQIILVSDGDVLGKNMYEYKDAKELIKLNSLIEKNGELNIFRHYRLKNLKQKYGLQYYINL